jgi:hypothetical protein
MDNSFFDTLINILVFVCIGRMIRIYLQDTPGRE